jgi:hypothetical protein
MLAYWRLGNVLWNLRRPDELDLLVRVLEPRRGRFSPLEQELFDDLDATAHGDWDRDLHALRALFRHDGASRRTSVAPRRRRIGYGGK